MKEKENLLLNSINNLDERLNKVMDYLLEKNPKKYKNQTLVAEAIGFTRPNLSAALKGDSKYLTKNIIEKFVSKFPELNKSWLLHGEGEMLNKAQNISYGNNSISGNNNNYYNNDNSNTADLTALFESINKQKNIEAQVFIKNFEDIIKQKNILIESSQIIIQELKKDKECMQNQLEILTNQLKNK